MPWLNTHLALPACVLAAYSVQQAWAAWKDRPADGRLWGTLASVALVSAGGLAIIAYLPGGTTYLLVRAAVVLGVLAAIWFAASPSGRQAAGLVAVTAVIGALGFFSIRTMAMAAYDRGDDPRDLLIYTQSSGELAKISREITALSEATGLGYNMPIAVDSADSFAWPWAWYLRDYKAVSYVDFGNGVPEGEFQVLLVANTNVGKVQDYLSNASAVQFGTPERYPHRWWFDEVYKYSMAIPPEEGMSGAGVCTGLQGDCGPLRPATWQRLWDGITDEGWVTTWLTYWRDHDPGRANGSVDAWAFFPANFDRATGRLSAKPIEPPKPGTDSEGRLTFGGAGFQPGQFSSPVDIEIDAEGNLYVIDYTKRKLQKFDGAGNYLAGVDVRTTPGSAEDSQPWGLTLAPTGEVIVADTFGWRVRVFDKDLQPLATFGDTPDTTKPVPEPTELFGPRDAAVDSQGQVWVTDTGHDRVQVFTLAGEFVRSVGSSGRGEGQFDEPIGIDIGRDGTVYVADMYNSRVQALNPDGTFKSQFEVEGWGGQEVTDKPYLTVLADGRIAVSLPSKNEVRVYSPSGGQVAVVDAGEEPLELPYGIVQTADAKLWIVEGESARVRQFSIP
jgi:hypothetical protein